MNIRKRKKIITRLQTKLRGRRPIGVTFSIVDLSKVVKQPITTIGIVFNAAVGAASRHGATLLGNIKKMKIRRSRNERSTA